MRYLETENRAVYALATRLGDIKRVNAVITLTRDDGTLIEGLKLRKNRTSHEFIENSIGVVLRFKTSRSRRLRPAQR